MYTKPPGLEAALAKQAAAETEKVGFSGCAGVVMTESQFNPVRRGGGTHQPSRLFQTLKGGVCMSGSRHLHLLCKSVHSCSLMKALQAAWA